MNAANVLILCLRKPTVSPAVKRFVAMFAGVSIVVLLLMMFSPEFPERAGFPSTVFLLIAALAALKEILPDVKDFCHRRIKAVTFAATVFAAVWTLSLLGCPLQRTSTTP